MARWDAYAARGTYVALKTPLDRIQYALRDVETEVTAGKVAYRDFTLEGPFEYTLGFSWVHDFNRTWAFVVAPDFHHLFGAAPSQHVDLNLGTQISF